MGNGRGTGQRLSGLRHGGAGRLAANETIVLAVLKALKAEQDLAGETVLVTAGPTREPIDPVRYIGNRSSGKMGYALAEAALRRGAKVILISGPTALKPPSSAEVIQVQTAQQMRDAVMANFDRATIVIKAAAVADFTVRAAADEKIKRKGPMTLELEPTADILAELAQRRAAASSWALPPKRPTHWLTRARSWKANRWMRSCSMTFRSQG